MGMWDKANRIVVRFVFADLHKHMMERVFAVPRRPIVGFVV